MHILFIALLWIQFASAIFLSSSSLNACIADGSQVSYINRIVDKYNTVYLQATLSISCRNEIVVTLAISASSGFDESVVFSLSCIGSSDGTCPCPCNYAVDPGCTCRDLEQPMQVALSKSPVFASYPMQYLQTVNYKPYEAIVRPSNHVCSASGSNPTCGYYFVGSSQVPDSQGFTCECSTSQIWDQTLGTNSDATRTRANLDCNFFSSPLDNLIGNAPCSASCLMFDPLWYSGYALGASSLQFDIQISITVPTSSPSSSPTPPVSPPPTSSNATGRRRALLLSSPPPSETLISETLQLNPSTPVAVSSSRMVSATLVGDLASYTSAPVLSDQVLLIPEPPGWTADQILTGNRSAWMVLGYNNFDLTDTQCNKIGTSFSAFKNQPEACFHAPQACLSGQIKDFESVDLARMAQGKVPLYLASRFNNGNLTASMRSFHSGPLSFALQMESNSQSLVVLKASADNVSFIINSSPGLIVGSRICIFSGATCGGFEAGAAQGFLWVNLTNTGSLQASFTLSFSNCSSNIRAVEARKLSIAAGATIALSPPIPILVEDTNANLARYCWLTLYDARGYVSDSKLVGFYTNATVFNTIPTGGLNGTGDGPGSGPKPGHECTGTCSKFYDIGCFVSYKCWSRIGTFFAAMIGFGLGLAVIVILLLKIGLVVAFLKSFCACFSVCGHGCREDGRFSGAMYAGHCYDRSPRERGGQRQDGRRSERSGSMLEVQDLPPKSPYHHVSPSSLSPFGLKQSHLSPPGAANSLSFGSSRSTHEQRINNPLYSADRV
jgi:hypothetical protein